jgi:hypothetical protein
VWALDHTNTWFITCRDLVNFMTAPVSTSEATTNTLFLTHTKTYYPSNSITACSYHNAQTFTVCGPCLPASPGYTNAYYGLVPLAGGAVSITISSQYVDYAACSLLVSNNTTNAVYNWQTSFTKSTGKVIFTNYDVALSQTGNLVNANAKQNVKHIAPGEFRQFHFLLTNGVAAFTNEQITLFQLGASDIMLQTSDSEPNGIQWSDNAHEYTVEWSSNLVEQVWNQATNKLFLPVFTNALPGPINPLFYRVKGAIY